MAFIYVITNQINGKQYVGKTAYTIEERWKEHKRSLSRQRQKHIPLYSAMRKYGIENFSIEQLEECSIEDSSKCEMYWIEKLDTYKNGYNATRGGDGGRFRDYNKIAQVYTQTQSFTKTQEICKCTYQIVKQACKETNTKTQTTHTLKRSNEKPVAALDCITKKQIKQFSSIADGSRWLAKKTGKKAENISPDIVRAIKTGGKCRGYRWIAI